MTSLYEGSPLVIHEAMEMGCCVISTDVGVVRDYNKIEKMIFSKYKRCF